jgi:hypothetical protein
MEEVVEEDIYGDTIPIATLELTINLDLNQGKPQCMPLLFALQL